MPPMMMSSGIQVCTLWDVGMRQQPPRLTSPWPQCPKPEKLSQRSRKMPNNQNNEWTAGFRNGLLSAGRTLSVTLQMAPSLKRLPWWVPQGTPRLIDWVSILGMWKSENLNIWKSLIFQNPFQARPFVVGTRKIGPGQFPNPKSKKKHTHTRSVHSETASRRAQSKDAEHQLIFVWAGC